MSRLRQTVELVSRLRLLTFDLDDTLWPCQPVICYAEQALYSWLRGRAPRLLLAHDLASLREHRMAFAETHPDLRHDLTALRKQALQELLVEHAYDAALADEGVEVFRVARDCVKPFGEVVNVLEGLRKRYILISITNGNARVENTPLRGLFHWSLSAAEVGAARPNPALFAAALAHVGVSAGQALHVGDDVRLDVAAAGAFGMHTAWVDRAGAGWCEPAFNPDFQVADLAELDRLLHATRT